MSTTQVFHLRDYELICSAHVLDNGKFQPALVLSRTSWPRRPKTIAMRREAFVTEALAIAAAHEQGLEWVTNYG
jgi:hypothetical protein